jgi:hypothetical protein
MEPQDRRLLQRLILASTLIVGVVLLTAFVGSQAWAKKVIRFQVSPCTEGPKCYQCNGLRIKNVCLGVEKITTTVTSPVETDLAVITDPVYGEVITSPLTITGKAKGSFYYNGTFPVKLVDGNGTMLGVTTAKAQGDWMTEEFVPFTATLLFTTNTPHGTANLVLERNKPSGKRETIKEIVFPVDY